ncbi:MAG: LUD domain-containing protein [Tannerellaceae bacterium]|jgi:L-lactate dehydrogenase complex protein LldG|nr:LUD domain-containing protein [Tannerellaceae bacterium]
MSDTILLNSFIQNVRAAGAEIIFSQEDADLPSPQWEDLIDFTRAEVRSQYQNFENTEKWYNIRHALFRGRLGVAENGAIWLEDDDMPHRIIPFIAEHLILIIKTENIVVNMHEAYNKLAERDFGFGVFICGPSKTADIEQSLVYGAHGAKQLTVVLFD